MGLYTKALVKWQLEGSVTDVRIEKQVERYKVLVGYSLSQSNQVDTLESNSSATDLTVFSLSCITCFVGVGAWLHVAAIITGSTREQFCLNAVCVRWQYTSTTPRGLHNLLNFMVGHTRGIHLEKLLINCPRVAAVCQAKLSRVICAIGTVPLATPQASLKVGASRAGRCCWHPDKSHHKHLHLGTTPFNCVKYNEEIP
ncbi:hypothetical protein V6N13_145642 [Hibiscus sabdariffa]|uniref:Uncharacterized protein n=1 Tax=Hibiscus sabdariffa TaxID=183260 RepID=A0ABR2TQ73_9ROSI